MSRVMVGDLRSCAGQEWVILAVERGRRGESRTVYVVGQRGADGVIRARETRGESVRDWPLIRRLRLEVTRSSRTGYLAVREIGGAR